MVIIILAFLGLCFGSFVNALVWRLHNKKDWVKERSICPNCKHKLAAKDLVPVLSWISLGGKCRYCHKPISAQYPLVELLVSVLFVTSYIFWPINIAGIDLVIFSFWLVFIVGLVALALYDLKWMLLPDKIIKPLFVLVLIQSLIIILNRPAIDNLTEITISFLIGGGLFYALFQISGGKWIGGGDVKLGALLGLILASPSLIVLTIFIASLIGTAMALPLIILGKYKRTSRIPFGPFLIAGAIIAQLFGHSIIRTYEQLLLY